MVNLYQAHTDFGLRTSDFELPDFRLLLNKKPFGMFPVIIRHIKLVLVLHNDLQGMFVSHQFPDMGLVDNGGFVDPAEV